MKVYIVSTGAIRYHEFMRKNHLRMLHLSNAWRNPIDGIPYAVDNGAFHSWLNNMDFNEKQFMQTLSKINKLPIKPDFVICPDIVAEGSKSLEFSIKWAKNHPRDDYYLAVQDGITTQRVAKSMNGFKGIFVGGTMGWKLSTSETWTNLAHQLGLECHIGRIGTLRRLLWARRIGADSIDSSTFVQGPPDGKNFRRILAISTQTCIDGPCNGGGRVICKGCALNPNK